MLIEERGFIDNETGEKLDKVKLDQLDDLIQVSNGRIQRKLNAIKKMIIESKSSIIISDGRITNPIMNAQLGTIFES